MALTTESLVVNNGATITSSNGTITLPPVLEIANFNHNSISPGVSLTLGVKGTLTRTRKFILPMNEDTTDRILTESTHDDTSLKLRRILSLDINLTDNSGSVENVENSLIASYCKYTPAASTTFPQNSINDFVVLSALISTNKYIQLALPIAATNYHTSKSYMYYRMGADGNTTTNNGITTINTNTAWYKVSAIPPNLSSCSPILKYPYYNDFRTSNRINYMGLSENSTSNTALTTSTTMSVLGINNYQYVIFELETGSTNGTQYTGHLFSAPIPTSFFFLRSNSSSPKITSITEKKITIGDDVYGAITMHLTATLSNGNISMPTFKIDGVSKIKRVVCYGYCPYSEYIY